MAVLARLDTPLHAKRVAVLVVGLVVLSGCSPAGSAPVASSGGSSAASAPLPSRPSESGGSPAGSPGSSASASTPSPSGSPAANVGASLLLEVRHVGGFINPTATIGAPSAVVVDTDGRIYTPQPDTNGSRPMIPVIDVRDTGAAGATAVLAAARDAGLAQGGSSGLTGDAGSTVFTLVAPDGSEAVTRVGSVGPGLPGGAGGPSGASSAPGGSTGGSPAPGEGAIALLARLTDPASPWPPSAAPAKPYVPSAYEVWVAPESAGGVGSATTEWPLRTDPNLFGKPAASPASVSGLRTGVVTGADAAAVATSLGGLTAGSDLVYEGHAYRVWVRPLLPDELAS